MSGPYPLLPELRHNSTTKLLMACFLFWLLFRWHMRTQTQILHVYSQNNYFTSRLTSMPSDRGIAILKSQSVLKYQEKDNTKSSTILLHLITL